MRRLTTVRTSTRTSDLPRSVEAAWSIVASGTLGPQWYADGLPMQVRGALDRLVGGGPPHPPPGRPLLEAGDRVGFWRVERADEESHELLMTAEVRAPGVVDLLTRVEPHGEGCRIVQRVRLRPSGLLGAAYLTVDLPARETWVELTHRRLVHDVRERTSGHTAS